MNWKRIVLNNKNNGNNHNKPNILLLMHLTINSRMA